MQSPKEHSGAAGRPRGFTFVELCVVIVILGLLLVLSIPAMRTAHDMNKLESSAHNLASVLRYARGQAVFDETTVEVRIDPKTGRYRADLSPSDEGRLGRHSRGEELYRPVERIRTLAEDVFFADVFVWEEQVNDRGHVVLEFFPNGTTTPVVLILEDKDGDAVTIELARSTGRVRTSKGRSKDVSLPGQTELVREQYILND